MSEGVPESVLASPLSVSPTFIQGPIGPLACYRGGPEHPEDPSVVVLIHSVNAAASTHEMASLFDTLAKTRRVFAFDLPGFGRSARPSLRYDLEIFTEAVARMLGHAAEVARAETGRTDVPVHGVGLSLSSEFIARAVARGRARATTLTLVTPTGFSRGSHKFDREGDRELPGFAFFLEGRPWSRTLYDWLTSRRSIRYFYRRTFGGPAVPETMVDYAYRTSRVEGAEHAPIAFLTGRLFGRDVRAVYEALDLPVFVPHGTRGDFKDFTESGWAEARGHWRFEPFAAGALPHVELEEAFVASFSRFLEES